MLHTIVFIHGTGVREPVYTALFSLVQQALSFRLGAPRIHLEPCYWGGNCGSKLFLDGASVPEADTTRAIDGEEDEADYHLALWGLLHRDPFAELDLLALRQPNGEPPPGREPPGYELYQLVQTLTIEPDELEPDQKQKLASLFATADLGSHFEVARAEVAEKYREVIEAATEPLGQCRVAIARAIVARSAQLYREVNDVPDGYLTLTGTLCDRVVDLLVAALGGQERDVGNWVEERAGRLIKHVATGWFRRRRGRYSEHFAPFGADIVIYQTRPRAIRDFIRDAVQKASSAAKARGETGELSLIAHSLGGIAAFDTLIEQPVPVVRHLITVGSQVPLLYELDALSSLPLRRDPAGEIMAVPHGLPEHFPKWLNIYDPRDFLSYRATPIFDESCVRDVEVDNAQPFPESHSAYWSNKAVWDAIADRLTRGGPNA